MTIISKSKKCVVNFDNVEKIYVSGDNVSIKADMKSGRGTELANQACKRLERFCRLAALLKRRNQKGARKVQKM